MYICKYIMILLYDMYSCIHYNITQVSYLY